jgi:sugar phosphate isomerase/epimerase
MRFTICNEIFKDWSFARACQLAQESGYEAIEVAPFTFNPLVTEISPARRTELRETARNAGLAISGIHWVLAYTEGFYVTHPDPAVRARTRDYLVAAIDFCADLGGRFMIFGSPKRRDLLPGVTPADGAAYCLDSFAAAIQRAEQVGVTICLEPLAPEETNFLNTAADAIALAERAQSKAFQVMLDVKAMCAEAKPIPQIIHESAGRFAYFHANDRNLKGPGFGDVDYGPIATALREVNYDGDVSVEVFKFEEGPEVIARESRRYLRQHFEA